MSETTAKIARWLRPLAFPFDAESPHAALITLRHVNVSDKASDVRSWKIPDGEEFDETALDSLVREMDGAILDDVEGIGGTQKYLLVAHDAEKKQCGRLPLRASAPMDDDGDEVGSEPATAKGLLAANMRHVDNAHRVAVGASAGIIVTLSRQNAKKDEMIEKLVARALDNITLAENLLSQRMARDIELDAARASQARKDKFLTTVTSLLGPVAKKLTGAGGPDADAPFNQIEMKTLFEGMTEQEFEGIKKSLGPERFFLFLSLMQSYKPDAVHEGPPRGDDEPEGSSPNGH
jgi:hypothetical protein